MGRGRGQASACSSVAGSTASSRTPRSIPSPALVVSTSTSALRHRRRTSAPRSVELEPISPAYRNRDARVRELDEQGVEACFMFPTLGVGMESALETRQSQPCSPLSVRSIGGSHDDWGCQLSRTASMQRAYITLADVDWAIEELEWALSNDARVINMRASSVVGEDGGRRSLGHPSHEPFWQRLNESGITLAIHSGDAGYGFMLDYWGQDSEFEAFRYAPLKSLLTYSPISDAIASLIAEGVFARHTNLRVATIENGSEWVWPLFKKLKKAYGQHSYAFAENPMDTFRQPRLRLAVLRRRSDRAARRHRRRPRAIRLRLAPRRRPLQPGRFHPRPRGLQRRGHQTHHARQRYGPRPEAAGGRLSCRLAGTGG